MTTILLVDDDGMILEYCTRVLAKLSGVQILRAHSGDEAIEIARRRSAPIDLLLSDVAMPGSMDGFELAECIENLQPGVRVLLMSGYFRDDLASRNSWQFLVKPFGPGDLVSKVEGMLRASACGSQWHQPCLKSA